MGEIKAIGGKGCWIDTEPLRNKSPQPRGTENRGPEDALRESNDLTGGETRHSREARTLSCSQTAG